MLMITPANRNGYINLPPNYALPFTWAPLLCRPILSGSPNEWTMAQEQSGISGILVPSSLSIYLHLDIRIQLRCEPFLYLTPILLR